MPLLFIRHLSTPDAPASIPLSFGVWQISENEPFFRNDLPLSPDEEAELALLKGIRRLEWLAARWLLHRFTGRDMRLPLAKDAFSKPFFPEHHHLACSLSHSHGIVGALLSNDPALAHKSEIGCDIQVIVEKMARLAPKFLRPEEAAFIQQYPENERLVLQHIFWTAKESLYKAYGLKELDFRAHLSIEPFEWDGSQGQGQGWVKKNDFSQAFHLQFECCRLPEAAPFVWTVAVVKPTASRL